MNAYIISNAESPYLEKMLQHNFNRSVPVICVSFNISVTKKGRKTKLLGKHT